MATMAETATSGGHVVQLIDTTVARWPERIAICDSAGSLTYAELDERSESLAQHLRSLGMGPGDVVGIYAPRSVAMVVAALGTLRAGSAYLAIDPTYPEERARWMLSDARAGAVIVAGVRAPEDLTESPVVELSDEATLPDGNPVSGGPLPEPAADDAAYVVYTSGSTGQPKGVLTDHGNLSNLIDWHCTTFTLDEGDCCTQIASPGFDAAVWEIWPSLVAGAQLRIVPEALRTDPVGLRDWLIEHGVTVGFVPTAVAETLIALEWPQAAPMRYLLTGGDHLSRRPRPGLPFTLVNNYGVSEATVVATSGIVSEGDGPPPSLGRAIAGVEIRIVDDELTPVAAGAEGEILIGGAAVGRGYLDRPELTAARFFDGDGSRWYRTGDLGRLTPDGELYFLGRMDDQLSIRGFRVEPGEIVAALGRHPAVLASAVDAVGDQGANRRVVACLVATGDERPEDAELTDFLRTTLPDYMCPSRYLWLDALPLTAHGKVDRRALQALIAAEADLPGATVEAVSSSTAVEDVEQTIGSILAELLDVEAVGRDENFFLLGGHSMLGAQLIVRLEDLYGVEISLRFLFDHPSPAELASEVSSQMEPELFDGSAA